MPPLPTLKVTRHNKAPLQEFDPVSECFKSIHKDIVGPLPYNLSFYYLLPSQIDFIGGRRHTISDISAETVARAFVEYWVAIFMVPETLPTYRAQIFEGELTSSLCRPICNQKLRTTSYHLQIEWNPRAMAPNVTVEPELLPSKPTVGHTWCQNGTKSST